MEIKRIYDSHIDYHKRQIEEHTKDLNTPGTNQITKDWLENRIKTHTRDMIGKIHEYNSNPDIKVYKRSMMYYKEQQAIRAARSNSNPGTSN